MKQAIVAWIAVLVSASVAQPSGAPADSGRSLPEDVDQSWFGRVQAGIREGEYRFQLGPASYRPGWGEVFQAPNRALDLRLYFHSGAVEILERSSDTAQTVVRLTPAGWGRAGTLDEPIAGALREVDGRMERLRGALTEGYANSASGLELSWEIGAPPTGEGPLVLQLDLEHASARMRGGGVEIVSASGRRLLLQAPSAADGNGNDLKANLVVAEPGRLEIVIDDAGASWPLRVKTLLTGAADTMIESNQDDARLGSSISTAGDVNGDGFADVIVGARFFDNGESDEGAAFVFLGSVSGIVGSSPTDAHAFLESNQSDAELGISVSTAGDVNGDGFDDIIVGAWHFDNGQVDEGASFVFLGSASGVVGSSPADAHALLESDQADAQMGRSVSTAGDVNRDGYADIIIGASSFNNGHTGGGAAFVFLGSASGVLGSSPIDAHAQLEANQWGALLGTSVSTAGDINGDGFDDIIVGAPWYDNGYSNEGAAFVFLGSFSGITGTSPADAHAQLESNQYDAYMGMSVSTAGDINGDGFADVIVGASFYDRIFPNEGAAFIFLGSSSGLIGWSPASAFATLAANQTDALMGTSVSTAGDVNGDGFADVIAGAPFYDNGQIKEGVALVFLGSATHIVGSSPSDAFAVLESNQVGAEFGGSVATAGDVNGDGFSDVIVGSHLYDNGESGEGGAFVFLGSASGIAGSSPEDAHVLLEPDQIEATLGYSVSTAGDINGDGFADVIVGAINYDNGQTDEGAAFVFLGSASGIVGSSPADAHVLIESNQDDAELGHSVSTAGDVNGDGFADVIVGADLYDNGQNGEGVALVFLGSASGIIGSSPADAHALIESNQEWAQLGWSVATAGDVNGDGFADVIVGAIDYEHGEPYEGVALVFLGSSAGIIGSSPAEAHALIESNEWTAHLGVSVSTAGDVNGDGFADVIVGAQDYSPFSSQLLGAALVFLGSASGVVGSNPTNAHALIQSDQRNDQLGTSVSTAGDVNGDGFADVIIGARGYDNGLTDEGAALVFLGSASGIVGSSLNDADAVLEFDYQWALLGASVSAAGDVNGDGFADVIVGAPGYTDYGALNGGAALVFLGSASGIVGSSSADAYAFIVSNKEGAHLGRSVSTAGDVNGDGFADVIIGAPWYSDYMTIFGGAALVFLGNSEGRPVQAQQLPGPGEAPIQPWAVSNLDDGFVVRMQATSPRGRELVRLEVEACPSGTTFGQNQCTTWLSPEWVDTSASPGGVELDAVSPGLVPGELYRWRVRTLYLPFSADQAGVTPPPRPAHGPWRRLGAQTEEADIRVPNAADLAVTVDDGQTTAIPGLMLTYTLIASNAGPNDAVGATVADAFPAELIGVSWTCVAKGGGSCTPSGTGDILDTADLPVGGSVTYTATAILDRTASGTLVNTATVTVPPGVTEPEPTNNTATDTNTIAEVLFADGFDTGTTSTWSAVVP